jgi:pimeloyl-ACP methyl ester carboxylesterase
MVVSLMISSCQKEEITIGTGVSETFYVENAGASMRVLVEGNTASKVFIVFVHGGPGASAYIYDTDYIRKHVGDNYALVYWDQRNSGASQGASNGKDLTLGQMTDDLKKVLLVIKSRYGQDCSLFLLGHSFGGLLTSSFLVSGDNQAMIKGWIFADASHNYPLNDSLTWQMLVTKGEEQITLNKNRVAWEEIVSYCNSHPAPFSYDESRNLEDYAGDAESYFPQVPEVDILKIMRKRGIRNDWPLTSILVNYLYSSNASFNKDLAITEYSTSLQKVTVPVLILFGEYDFVCPAGMGEDLYKRIGSTDKKMVISPVSGHSIMLQDEVLFCSEINSFVGLHR